ncbi:MAG: Hpt domain-containing protein [Pseudomonadota bacterium]
MSEAMQQAVHVVSGELNKTVNLARVALEDAVEGRSTRQALEKCAVHLHETAGVLKMVEVYGGALLAEEMEFACQYLLQPRSKETLDEGLDALTRSMVQLPAYLERMAAGGRDVALVLLPLLNDLRALRGQPLLSESTILLLNRKPSEQVTVEQRGSEPSEDFIALSRKVRPAFQLALLGLLKADQDSARPHLDKLRNMSAALERAANRDDVYRLWWVVGGVIDALQDGGLPISISVKRLLGQADRRIKRVIDDGIETFDSEPVTDLLNSLLYYIARAENPSESVLAIRQAFGLMESLPTQAEVDNVHGAMAGPSVALMQTVAAAIREDLTAVKDVLDIHVRTAEKDLTRLEPQIELLAKISDTLGVLGLGDQRASVIAEVERLQALIKLGPEAADTDALLAVAGTLLEVESSLEQRLTQLVAPTAPAESEADEPTKDMRDVQRAVMRECIVNVARIKDTLSEAIAGKLDPAAIDAVPVLAEGVQSGFRMLELARAQDVFDRLTRFVQTFLRASNQTLANEHQDRLADALVSIEYYMETIEAGRKEPVYMLDNAEMCLRVLDEVRKQLESTSLEDQEYEPTIITKPGAAAAIVDDDEKGVHAPVVKNDTRNIDPELLELFIEEAREEVRTIQKLLPQWHANNSDVDSLITVRRSFHTLKGSGRMVGAERIGEYSWAIENLLNRVINRTLPLTPAMSDFIVSAADAVPELIEQLEVGVEPKIDVDLLALKAQAFVDGDPGAAELLRESAVSNAPALEMDPVLYEIFAREANGYLATIGAFVDGADSFPVLVSDAMHRACHTLHGSINAASLDRAMPLSGALNQMIRRVHEGRVGLDKSALTLVNEAAHAIDAIVHSINDPNASDTPIDGLTRQIEDKTAAIAHEQSTLVTELLAEDPADSYEPTHVLTRVGGDVPPVSAATRLDADPAFDAEIVEIFTEEAAELLESVDVNFTGWRNSRDAGVLAELQRTLHTLKGSANMAGISDIGNLSHELETLLTALVDKRIEPAADIDGLLRQSFDSLHQMHEIVVSGHYPSAATRLEQMIRSAAQGRPVPTDEAATPTTHRGFGADELVEIPDASPNVEDVTDMEEASVVIDRDEIDLEQVFAASTTGVAEPTDTSAADDRNSQTIADTEKEFDEFGETQDIGGEHTPIDFELEQFATLDDTQVRSGEHESTSDWVADTFEVDDQLVPTRVSDNVVPITGSAANQADDAFAETQVADEEQDDQHDEDAKQDFTQSLPAISESIEATPPDPSDTLIQRSRELEKMIEDAAQRFADDVPGDFDLHVPGEGAPVSSPEPEPQATTQTEPEPAASPLAASAALPGRESVRERIEYSRVDSRLLEDLLNAAGEISIFHGRLSQQVSSFDFHLAELGQTVTRLRDQLRQMEIETEAQILTRHEPEGQRDDFDPLELDRYSKIQQLSRALAETSNDVDSLKGLLESVASEADTLLTQQSRVTAELQGGLMRTRMIPFERHVARFERIVRQAAAEVGKSVSLAVEGASAELDRQVLEKMLPPLEHMMRNAVVHGIESAQDRRLVGKSAEGQITIRLHREGSEMVLDIADDGQGLDVAAIRRKGVERGLIRDTEELSDDAIIELILEPGFSTAEQLTQAAGRGVGMDVVASEVKKLGGSLSMHTMAGQGTRFTVRLPFTLALTQALVVRSGDEVFALPLPTVEGVVRITRSQVDNVLASAEQVFEYAEHSYKMRHLAPMVDGAGSGLPEGDDTAVAVILIRAGRFSTALLVDEMLASREIVVKAVGPQIAGIAGVSGATILGDGRVVLILDMPTLVRREQPLVERTQRPAEVQEPLVLVVDDSITVRRVTERFLKRNNFRAATARDGLDAVSVIQEQKPDLILLDIEMPRMDGFEFASHVRNDPRFAQTPIIMITSRSGEKHKARAIELGVNDYLGKPYQDNQLLLAIRNQLEGQA